MKNIISIIKVNDYALDSNIDRYMSKTQEEPYIFMSEDTMKVLAKELGWDYKPVQYSSNVVGEYFGCKIYYNNDLKFGEVELR